MEHPGYANFRLSSWSYSTASLTLCSPLHEREGRVLDFNSPSKAAWFHVLDNQHIGLNTHCRVPHISSESNQATRTHKDDCSPSLSNWPPAAGQGTPVYAVHALLMTQDTSPEKHRKRLRDQARQLSVAFRSRSSCSAFSSGLFTVVSESPFPFASEARILC